jgi:hypothetical protein
LQALSTTLRGNYNFIKRLLGRQQRQRSAHKRQSTAGGSGPIDMV